MKAKLEIHSHSAAQFHRPLHLQLQIHAIHHHVDPMLYVQNVMEQVLVAVSQIIRVILTKVVVQNVYLALTVLPIEPASATNVKTPVQEYVASLLSVLLSITFLHALV